MKPLISKSSLPPSWVNLLQSYIQKPEFKNLIGVINKEYTKHQICPKAEDVFQAFWLTPFEKVKVVILGQDPYHGQNQAHGLAFSDKSGNKIPPSLRNIYKEIESEFGIEKDYTNGGLTNWGEQGVLLLNSILTVIATRPASHRNLGWEGFTDQVISKLSKHKENLVFLLWGNFARSKKILINQQKHLVLESSHPSPFSARKGFLGCNHFKTTNQYLQKIGENEIKW